MFDWMYETEKVDPIENEIEKLELKRAKMNPDFGAAREYEQVSERLNKMLDIVGHQKQMDAETWRYFANQIDDLKAELDTLRDSYQEAKEYNDIEERLKALYEMQTTRKQNKTKRFEITGDTILKCGCYMLLGTMIIFKEELIGPVASKALPFIKVM